MKKLKNLLLTSAVLGLFALTMPNAFADQANTDKTVNYATYNSASNESTVTTAQVNNDPRIYKGLFQLTLQAAFGGTPDPVSTYDSSVDYGAYGVNLRVGFATNRKLNYDSPVFFTTNYFTLGLNSLAYNFASSDKVKATDWSSVGFSIGDIFEMSRTDLYYLKSYIMPIELSINRESFTIESETPVYLNTSNYGYAYVTKYNESRGTVTASLGIGASFFHVYAMAKAGYNFTQSAFILTSEIGISF